MSVKVIKFGASWCSPCKSVSNLLKKIQTEVLTEEVDIDEEIQLTLQYGIRSVPVLIALKDGLEVDRLSGSRTQQSLQNWYNKLATS